MNLGYIDDMFFKYLEILTQFCKHISVGVIFNIVGLIVLWWWVDNLGYTAWKVALITVPIFSTLRFFVNKYYVFKRRDFGFLRFIDKNAHKVFNRFNLGKYNKVFGRDSILRRMYVIVIVSTINRKNIDGGQ